MAHWDEERDRDRVDRMRKCGRVAAKYSHVIDHYEKTGDIIYWSAFVEAILQESKPGGVCADAASSSYPQK